MPAQPTPPCVVKPPCQCYESIDLSDEDTEEDIPEIPEVPIGVIPEVGATEEELDVLRFKLDSLATIISKLTSKFESNQLNVENNFKKMEQNVRFLGAQIAQNTKEIAKNKSWIEDLMKEFDLLRSQLDEGLANVGSEIDGLGDTDLSGVLVALEE